MRGIDTFATRSHPCPVQMNACTPSTTEGSTVTDGCADDDEVNNTNLFELHMRHTFAERQIGDLERELTKAKTRATEAECRVAQYKDALLSTDPDEAPELRLELEKVKKERNAAVISRDEARKEMEAAKLEAEKLRKKLEKTSLPSFPLGQDMLKHHENLLVKIGELMRDKEALMEEKFKLKSENRKCTDAADFFKNKNENLKHDIKELQTNLTLSENEKARYAPADLENTSTETSFSVFTLLSLFRIHNDHVRLLSARNSAPLAPNTPLVPEKRCASENTKLKERIKTLEARINAFRSNTASYITRLDLAGSGYNVFSCSHNSLRDITFGKIKILKSTQIRDSVFDDMIKEWKNDSQFFEEYFQARSEVLQHHHAHQKVQSTIAASYASMRKRFAKLDRKRGIEPQYD